MMTDDELAKRFSESRIIPAQTNISGELAIRYAHDAAMDMAEFKNVKMMKIFNFVSLYLPEHIREETLEMIKNI